MGDRPHPPTDEHGPLEFESTYQLGPADRAALDAGETVSFWHSTNEVIHLEGAEDDDGE